MEPITIMLNGLPGNMARMLAGHLLEDARFVLIPWSLTGPEISQSESVVNGKSFRLVLPQGRDEAMRFIRSEFGDFVAIDFTHPSAVNDNAVFYRKHRIRFVMGTTGGDREALAETVKDSAIAAVIAPNMAKQIVGFQAMMAWAAEHFPGLFDGYSLTVKESHQQSKADTSGTAKAMVGYFNRLGADFSVADIQKVRDPEAQQALGVPKEYLGGHGWHTYTLISPDQTVKFEFTHNVNGRDIYAPGVKDAVLFLSRDPEPGRVYSMIDVLQGSRS